MTNENTPGGRSLLAQCLLMSPPAFIIAALLLLCKRPAMWRAQGHALAALGGRP